MWRYNTPDELYHYGILGMRWKHRKAQIKKSKKLKEMKRKAKQEEFNKDVENEAKVFGADHVRRSANRRALFGITQLAIGASRFKQAKNTNFGLNGQIPMLFNAGINTAITSRGIKNIIDANKTKRALNEYEYNRLNRSKNKKR